jgi:hypothetical protein
MARLSVCSMRTVVRPSATLCVGPLAPIQPAVRLLVSTLRPPSARPSATVPAAACAAARAASWADWRAAMACAA